MAMAVPRPVTLDDITYVFQPGRKCNRDTIYQRHCHPSARQWWTHQSDRGEIGRYYVDMPEPITIRIRICACRGCGHPALDLEKFRNAFMEDSYVAGNLEWRRRIKVEAHERHDLRVRADAALATCEGVDTARLTRGLLKRLLETPR